MVRETNKLTAPQVRAIKKPGRHSDGGGLYLVVEKTKAKRWAFLFRWDGKLKEMGLGGVGSVTLARAREKATEARAQLADGKNPIEARKASLAIPTFGEMADKMITALSPGWRNAKHRAAWKMTLEVHARALRQKRVDAITSQNVLDVLTPLADRPETASRLRGRIERVLDAARASGSIRSPWENPARWRGHLKHLMPGRAKLSRGHHKAMPFADVPAFLVDLRQREAPTARALEFLILTASRSDEVISARWNEFDLKAKLWTVPAERMKLAEKHRVPLSTPAVALLVKAREEGSGGYVFPGPRKVADKERPLSNNAMRALLQDRMGLDVTPHGFRSSFRDWAGDETSFQREVVEEALAHKVGDETERAYRRGDALEKRRKLMDAWAGFLAHGGAKRGNVTPLRGVA